MYRLIRRYLFEQDAEAIHHRVMDAASAMMAPSWMRGIARSYQHVRDHRLRQLVFGVSFPNPVGLGAGFDKNARHFNTLSALGFGFVEVGTVTALPQAGNPLPRLFRLPEDNALLNRMGFNNEGCLAVAERLGHTPWIEPVLGINIGKSKVTPLEHAHEDYELTFRSMFGFARYIVVNVSSPNTPNLRTLQDREPLLALLQHLQAVNNQMATQHQCATMPVLLKIAPDLNTSQLDDVLDVIKQTQIDGIIATNTTIRRDGLKTPGQSMWGAGGISGQPLTERSRDMVSTIYKKTHGQLPIIGVGGIASPDDARLMMEAGASLLQVWTGFVYQGPQLIREINRHLLHTCQSRGLDHISQLVGWAHRAL